MSQQWSLVPTTFSEARQFAELMAQSDLVPKDYRGRPGNVLVAVAMGHEIGLSPMQSIQNISVINGRPSLWGDAMLAVCAAHPSCEDIRETFDESTETATCEVRRKGRSPVVRTFARTDAERAGLWGKQGPWQQYPRRMLQMRARAFALRDSFADVLRGLQSAEEQGDVPVIERAAGRSETPRASVASRAAIVSVTSPDETRSPNTAGEASTASPAVEVSSAPEPDGGQTLAGLVARMERAATEQDVRLIASEYASRLPSIDRDVAREVYREQLARVRAVAPAQPPSDE